MGSGSVVFDQHFMKDRRVMERIVSLAEPRRSESVLEIGAGDGRLTDMLSDVFGRVVAIEMDRRFLKPLKELGKRKGNIEILFGNALEIIGSAVKESDKIVSNVPYAISESLMKRLMRFPFRLAVLTLPQKFAQRIVAEKGSKYYSTLSFLSRVFFDARLSGQVPREAFEPPPRTESEIVVLMSRKRDLLQAFFLREKMLVKNALREALCETRGLTKRQARKVIEETGLGEEILGKRVRELDVEEMENVEKGLEKG